MLTDFDAGNVSDDVGGEYGDAHGESGQYDGGAYKVKAVTPVRVVGLGIDVHRTYDKDVSVPLSDCLVAACARVLLILR